MQVAQEKGWHDNAEQISICLGEKVPGVTKWSVSVMLYLKVPWYFSLRRVSMTKRLEPFLICAIHVLTIHCVKISF